MLEEGKYSRLNVIELSFFYGVIVLVLELSFYVDIDCILYIKKIDIMNFVFFY